VTVRQWRGRNQAILVTSAPPDRLAEIRTRQRRYLITMGIRVVCFILAVALFTGPVRVVLAALSIVLPWVAVVAANAGPCRPAEHPALYRDRPRRELDTAAEPTSGSAAGAAAAGADTGSAHGADPTNGTDGPNAASASSA